MSSFIYPGDSKVKVNNFTTPRGLTFTGSGVSVTEDSANNKFTVTITAGSGSGETNTYSNAGLEGVGITLTKDDVDFPFKAIAAGSTKVTVTDDTDNKTVDIDVDESALDLANIGGTATWTQVSKTGSVLNDIADVVEDSPAQYDVIQRDGSSQWVGAKITNDNIDDAAAITTSKLADSATLLTTTNTKTITNKTVDFKDNTVLNSGIYLFTVFKSGTTYYLRNNETGVIVTSNSDPTTVLQAAIDNCSSNSASACLIKRGTYLLTAQLVGIDKNFRLHGEGMLLTGNTGITNSDTILKANYTGAAGEALIDCTNTVYSRQQFFDLVIDCSNTVPYGILAYDVRERYPWLQNVAVLDATDVGIRASKVVYTTCYNVVVASCTNIGLQLYDAGGGVMPNTMYWYGGRMTSNGINIQIDSSTDVSFNQVVLESGTVNCVKTTVNAAKQIRYRDCSFEWHPVTTTNIACDDSGVNITYDNCRFDSNNTTYYPNTIRAAARQVQIINCKYQANNASTTANITIESGAQDTVLIGNQQNTNTPMTVTLTDNGTRTVAFGNSFDNVKFTGLTDIITLKDSTTNNAGDILVNNATRFTRKARGSANQFVKVNAAGNDTGFEALDVTLDTNALTTSNTKTVTNKTVNLTNNTVTDTSTSAGDLAKSDGTKFTRFARGTLYGQVPRVNSGQTDIEYARQAVFPSSNLFGTQGRRWGTWFLGTGTSGAGIGLLNSITVNGSNPAFATFTATDGSRPARFTPTASTGATNGFAIGTVMTCRQWNPRFKCRFRLNNKADTRFFIGFNNTGGVFTTDDPLNTKAGIAFGKIDDAVNTNFVIMHNDGIGVAATVLDTVAAADNSIHQIEIVADDTNSKWSWSFDNGAFTDITTEVPGSTTGIGFAWNCETTNTTQPTFDIFWVEMESD